VELLVSFDFPPKIGGAHHWMYEQYRRWPTGVRVLTAPYSSDPGEAAQEHAFDARDHGALEIVRAVPVRAINVMELRFWRTCLQQWRTIAAQCTEPVTHVHAVRAFPEGFAAMLYRATRARRARLVTYAHGEEILVARTSRQLTLVARAVYAASDLVIANSEGTRRLVADLCRSARIVRVSPGVDSAAWIPPREDVERYRRAWGWPHDTVVIVTVARMERRKNHLTVLEAVANLRRNGLSVAYVCGGDGEERAGLRQRAAALGIEPWVTFPGAVSDTEKTLAFAASHIHAMPSIRVGPMIEGFGIVFIEAAAAGLPSIAGNTGGQGEAVIEGRTGLIVDGTHVGEVCRALERLATDPDLRLRMGAAGRQWAAQHDWSRVAQAARGAIADIA
jgi:phosphatidylinositol alpha-1,6-mannosyltransferase